ncbi:MAG: hypothetical protein Q9167_004200 [Letrouitia subvulpina]
MSEPDFDLFEWLRRSAVPESPPPASTSSGDQTANESSTQTLSGLSNEEDDREHVPQQENSDSSTPTILGKAASSQSSDGRSSSSPIAKRSRRYRDIQPHLVDATILQPQNQLTKEFYNASVFSQGRLPKEPHKRRRINQPGDSYRETRKKGSCAACWLRQVKCGDNEYCEKCATKGLPQELCCRTRVKDLSKSHPRLATKFIDSYRGSIRDWETDEGTKKVVKLWHGLDLSFPVTVTKYTPRQEITDLFWKEPNGWQLLVHTSYGIQDADEIDTNALDAYTWAQFPHALDQIEAKKSDADGASQEVAWENAPPEFKTPNQVWLHSMRTAYEHVDSLSGNNEEQMLRTALLLWTYTFLQYHGLWQFTLDDNYEKLGMSKLVSHTKNCETLTPFEGTTPLPRLLSQQIHTCIEGRMNVLEQSLVKDLHNTFLSTSRDKTKSNWRILYLTTWVYLSVLEEIVWDAGRWINLCRYFNWPLSESPNQNIEKASHSARTILAHYHHALRNKPFQELYELDLKTRRDVAAQEGDRNGDINFRSNSANSSVDDIHNLFKDTSAFAAAKEPSLKNRLDASFDANDIRSLELKFAAMMIT